MSLETRNRLLTIIFLLLITLLVGELSYFFFNHRNTFTPKSPPPSSTTQISTTSPTPTPSTTHTPTTPDEINTRLKNLSSFFSDVFPFITKTNISYTLKGKVIKVTSTTISLKTSSAKEPLDLFFIPTTRQKLQIITPQGQVSHQLTSIPLNSTITVTVTKDILQPNPHDSDYPATVSAIINIIP